MLVSVPGVPPCVAQNPDLELGRSTAFRFTLREILYRYKLEKATRMERLRGRLQGEGMSPEEVENICGQFVVGHRPGKERWLRRSYDEPEVFDEGGKEGLRCHRPGRPDHSGFNSPQPRKKAIARQRFCFQTSTGGISCSPRTPYALIEKDKMPVRMPQLDIKVVLFLRAMHPQ